MKRWMTGGVLVFSMALAAGPVMAGQTRHFERSFPAAAIGEVEVDVDFHDVRVVASPGDTVRVTIDLETGSGGARAETVLAEAMPRVTLEGKVLEIESRGERHYRRSPGGVSGTVTIHLPPGRHLSLDTASGDCRIDGDLGSGGLDVETSSGEVVLAGSVGDAEIDTASGDVRLDLARPAGAIEVQTSSGNVVVHGELTRLEAETSSGSVSVKGSCNRVELESSSGDLTIRWERVPPGALADLETSSGDVTIIVPVGAAVAGMVTTSSGEIASDLPGVMGRRKRVLELTATNPVLRLEVSTSSGDISLKTTGD